jgi:hypothetical protein
MQPPLFQRSSRFGYRRWRRSGWLLVRLAPDTPHFPAFGFAFEEPQSVFAIVSDSDKIVPAQRNFATVFETHATHRHGESQSLYDTVLLLSIVAAIVAGVWLLWRI